MEAVSYEFYRDTYHGELTQAAFEHARVFAEAYVDDITMGRIPYAPEESVALRIRLAVCAVADLYDLTSSRTGIAAETNDGISVTYESGTGRSEERALYNTAAVYLAQTGLLYRGVC